MKPLSPPSIDIPSYAISLFDKLVDYFPTFGLFLKNFFWFLVGISLPLSLFFFIGIIYCVEQLKYIRKKEDEKYNLKVVPAFEDVTVGAEVMALRWESVKKNIITNNPNDWKQAINDADIILDDILNKLGYQGESVGEKLKRVAKGDFKSVNDAWMAHKIRNQIAHEAGYELTHYDARLAVDAYKRVFEEFYYL